MTPPLSEILPARSVSSPAIRIFHPDSSMRGPRDMAIMLRMEVGLLDVGVWLSAPDARRLGAALVAHADAFEVQFPVIEVAA